MNVDRPKIRAGFDCMVFLQGTARRESPAARCLLLVELDVIELYVTDEIMAEVRDVLARPRVRQKFPTLTDRMADQFLAALEKRAVVLSDVPRLFKFDRDPKDEPYINLAITAPADHLVSRDNDLLDPADASTPDGERLPQQAPLLRIVDPGAFLAEIPQASSGG
jgi:putative PIN family toxin of toxin-antitoxin system